jgi:hypothetical protein
MVVGVGKEAEPCLTINGIASEILKVLSLLLEKYAFLDPKGIKEKNYLII